MLIFVAVALKKTLFFKSDGCRPISRQEKRRLPISTPRFPAKKRWYSPPPPPPPPVGLSWDSTPPSPESVRAGADVTTKISRIDRLPNLPSTKISRIDRLPNLPSNGAPLQRHETEVLSILKQICKYPWTDDGHRSIRNMLSKLKRRVVFLNCLI